MGGGGGGGMNVMGGAGAGGGMNLGGGTGPHYPVSLVYSPDSAAQDGGRNKCMFLTLCSKIAIT